MALETLRVSPASLVALDPIARKYAVTCTTRRELPLMHICAQIGRPNMERNRSM